jgi:hypothetical protein
MYVDCAAADATTTAATMDRNIARSTSCAAKQQAAPG